MMVVMQNPDGFVILLIMDRLIRVSVRVSVRELVRVSVRELVRDPVREYSSPNIDYVFRTSSKKQVAEANNSMSVTSGSSLNNTLVSPKISRVARYATNNQAYIEIIMFYQFSIKSIEYSKDCKKHAIFKSLYWASGSLRKQWNHPVLKNIKPNLKKCK